MSSHLRSYALVGIELSQSASSNDYITNASHFPYANSILKFCKVSQVKVCCQVIIYFEIMSQPKYTKGTFVFSNRCFSIVLECSVQNNFSPLNCTFF